jgi:hypothetical protein
LRFPLNFLLLPLSAFDGILRWAVSDRASPTSMRASPPGLHPADLPLAQRLIANLR